nr:PREDICTED: protein bicaudal C homolog 1-B-like [Latimeria chalumnae]|eukprot:XP_005989418.1 PREDICTED: protein bicaudal C homolog 1-B-like [Latimeria chalumnae]
MATSVGERNQGQNWAGCSKDLVLEGNPGKSTEVAAAAAAAAAAGRSRAEKDKIGNVGAPSIPDPDWLEERFRVDRKKLETMVQTPTDENGQSGEDFFQKVMDETNTHIKWPSKLKIGAKSKKGNRNALVNKVTLKMDVSYTEHSHVIGKGGNNIKKVMEDTGCHIHFPDSNRNNNHIEKSNQVSIAGPVSGVESARKHIRELQPLALMFDVPIASAPQLLPDVNSPIIQHLMQTLNVTVSFKQNPKFLTTVCTVKGLQGNSSAVKKATMLLMELLVGPELSASVSTQLDITPQQHLFLMGQSGANIISIMQTTQTQLIFPEPICLQAKTTLLIQGTVDSVCMAKQQLLDSLPVCLMFDMKEDIEVDPQKNNQLMEKFGVFISIKPKPKQTAKSVVVKSLERNMLHIYEARQLLLGLESNEVTLTTKSADEVSLPNEVPSHWLNLLTQQLSLTEQVQALTAISSVLSALNGQTLQVNHRPGHSSLTTSFTAGLTLPQGVQAPTLTTMLPVVSKLVETRPAPPPGLTYPVETQEAPPDVQRENSSVANSSKLGEPPKGPSDKFTDACVVRSSSPVHSKSNTASMNPARGDRQSESSEKPRQEGIVEPQKPKILSFPCFRKQNANLDFTTETQLTEENHRTEDQMSRLCSSIKSEACNYEKKKLLATKAMQRKPVVTEVRTPTDTWSGLGFSKSMPAEAVKELRCVNRRCYKSYLATNTQVWNNEKVLNGSNSDNWREHKESTTSTFPCFTSSGGKTENSCKQFLSSSNCFDSISSLNSTTAFNVNASVKQTSDLPELFSKLGLSKYIHIFQQQEIDFQTFLTLTDEDLKELGISTFGARRKMLLAISDLNKNKRKLLDPPTVRSGYLEGGASGRLPRLGHSDLAAQSNHW